MATISRGDWVYAAAVFMVANIGIAASFVFYDSLLPHIAAPDEMDRVSTAAYAIGYLGGGVLLLVNLAWILSPATVRPARIRSRPSSCRSSASPSGGWSSRCRCSSACREPAPALEPDESRGDNADSGCVRALAGDVSRAARLSPGVPDARRLPALQRRHPDDHPHGVDLRRRSRHRPERADRGLRARAVRRRAVLVPVRRAGRIASAPSRASSSRLRSTPGISMLGYFMTTAWQFFALAFLVGTVQGGSQALSRSLFARMIPEAQVVGVLRLLLRLREVRRHRRTGAVCGVGHAVRLEPRGGAVGDRVLRAGRHGPDPGRRGRRARHRRRSAGRRQRF